MHEICTLVKLTVVLVVVSTSVPSGFSVVCVSTMAGWVVCVVCTHPRGSGWVVCVVCTQALGGGGDGLG